jgi:hypothetical protein
MPASSGIFSLLDLIKRDPNAGGARGIPQPRAAMPSAGGPGAPAQSEQGDIRSQRVGGGMPAGVGGVADAAADPNNWFMTRGDLESPLAYMGASSFGSPYAQGGWQPNDKGGYFTLDQLYQGRGIPNEGMQFKSNFPSTNNWQLTVPYGGGQGAIMRNGMVVWPGSVAAGLGLPYGHTGSAGGGGADTSMQFPLQIPPFGSNIWGMKYWPGGQPWSGGGGQGNYLT